MTEHLAVPEHRPEEPTRKGLPPRLGRPKSYPKTVVELLKKLYRASASATFVLVDRELNHHRWKEGRKSTLFALNS